MFLCVCPWNYYLQKCNILMKQQSEALVAYPLAYHTLYTAQASNTEISGDNNGSEEQKQFISMMRRLILRLVSSCARLSLRLLSLLMNSCGTIAPPFLKTDEMCHCLSAVLPLTADFMVGDTMIEAWARAESLLPLPCHHSQLQNSTHHPASVLVNRFPWDEMRCMSASVQWPEQLKVVLPCSLMLLHEARDVVKCICNGFGDNLSAIAITNATIFASAFKRNIQMYVGTDSRR